PTDPLAYVTTFTYNADGRLLDKVMPQGNAIQYTYDEGNPDRFQRGNLLKQTRVPDATRGGDQTAITTTYSYEAVFNHIVTMTEPRGNDPSYVPQNGGVATAARYKTHYTYNANGNATRMDKPTVTLPDGTLQTIRTDY